MSKSSKSKTSVLTARLGKKRKVKNTPRSANSHTPITNNATIEPDILSMM